MREYLVGLGVLMTLVSGIALAHLAPSPLWLRVFCAVAGGMTVQYCYRCLIVRKPGTSQGTAGFASRKEWATLAFDIPQSIPHGAILLGTHQGKILALPHPYTMQHGVIIGGSGTGKSFSFFLPNMALANGVSCVATDVKGELWDYTSGYHARASRYAPMEPNASAGFNWITLCGDARMASLCARAIVEAGETNRQEAPWPDLETAFLAALFSHTSTLSVPTPLTAYQLLTRSEPESLMDQFMKSSSWVAREQAVIFKQTNERMRGSITPVLAAKLQFMRDSKIVRFTSSDFTAPDFGRLRVSPEALYWCVMEQDMVLLRGLSALFFTVLLDQLAHESVPTGEGIQVHLHLDEFANIGLLPHYETTISLARGRGLSIWHGLQSLSQLESRYGKAGAHTILTNCATKIAFSGLDVTSAEYVSRALGDATVTVMQRSWQRRHFALFAGAIGVSEGERSRPLLTADEVRRIGEDQLLTIIGNRRPLLLEKWWYGYPKKTAKMSGLGDARTLDLISERLVTETTAPKPEPESPPVFRSKPSKRKRPRRTRTTIVTKLP